MSRRTKKTIKKQEIQKVSQKHDRSYFSGGIHRNHGCQTKNNEKVMPC